VPVARLICLANSRKDLGRCIAGKVVRKGKVGGWVRPVSERPTGELTPTECVCGDDHDPCLLDVLELTLGARVPHKHQSENWSLQRGAARSVLGRVAWRHLPSLADTPPSLWDPGFSTYRGLNDRVPADALKGDSGSLFFVQLEQVMLRVVSPSADRRDPKRRVQANFTYNSVAHRLWVTDPVIEAQFGGGGPDESSLGPCYATISLGEEFIDGFCYKLLAALITQERATG
jgi:hypothetical protein